MKTTQRIYSQFLLNSQNNYTYVYLSQHFEGLDENSIYRYLHSQKLTPSLVWEKAESVIEYDFSHDNKGDKIASGYLGTCPRLTSFSTPSLT